MKTKRESAVSSSLCPVLARNLNIKKKSKKTTKKLNNTNTKAPSSTSEEKKIQ